MPTVLQWEGCAGTLWLRLAKQGFGRPSLPVLFEDECLVPTRRHPKGGPLQAPVSHL